MIVKNRLLNYKNTYIYQNDEWFKFSLDSVLLVNFATIRLNDKKILELCSGNAPIPMLLTYKTKAKIYGVELQSEIYKLGVKSIFENKMDSQIELINDDIKNIINRFENDSFDLIFCNPPYFKVKEDSNINNNLIKSIARHEIKIDLDTIISVSSILLKNGGNFAMVHRVDRFVEIIDCMRKYKIEPKKIQFVYPKRDSNCNLILIEGKKNGKGDLKVLSPLVVSNDDGSYCDLIRSYYQE